MAQGFLARNWKLLAGIVGFIAVREVLQRRKFIDVQGQVVLITGGSRGFGLVMAEEFTRWGAKLVICAREDVELERARQHLAEIGAEVLAVRCDVTDVEEVQHLVNKATEHFGRIDILVNNAGIISVGPWQTLTRQDFENSMDIIFWGTYNTTMAVLPQMTERKSGRIVNIASIGGKVSVPHLLSYSTAKFAVEGFSAGMHAELARENIVVTTVSPGLMRTGSPVNVNVKGQEHRQEYTLFALADALPVSSIAARRAARQVVNATRRGDTELIITIPAQIAARLYGVLPGLVTDLMAVVNRFLPRGDGQGTALYRGKDSATPLSQSFLTKLSQRASEKYNEYSNNEK